MDDAAGFGVTPEEVIRFQAAIQGYILEMQRANERMKKDQEEIQRSKQRTRVLLAELEDE